MTPTDVKAAVAAKGTKFALLYGSFFINSALFIR